jgi:chitinase
VSYMSVQRYAGDMNQTWPIQAFNAYLDWANVMNYDYHGSWEPNITGEHTALYDPNSTINTNYGISNWLEAGLHPDKLCLGLAYYGKEWNLTSLDNVGVDAPARGGGDPIIYRDIVAYNQGGATVVYDPTTVCMYSYKSSELTWIGYDNPDTIAAKVRYAKSRNLLGYFAWALQHDTNPSSLAAAGKIRLNT